MANTTKHIRIIICLFAWGGRGRQLFVGKLLCNRKHRWMFLGFLFSISYDFWPEKKQAQMPGCYYQFSLAFVSDHTFCDTMLPLWAGRMSILQHNNFPIMTRHINHVVFDGFPRISLEFCVNFVRISVWIFLVFLLNILWFSLNFRLYQTSPNDFTSTNPANFSIFHPKISFFNLSLQKIHTKFHSLCNRWRHQLDYKQIFLIAENLRFRQLFMHAGDYFIIIKPG